MDWLNLHTSTLDSPEFVGSSPVERSTWLCLLRFCIGQENSGRIVGGRTWKDRQWQQLARVTLREVSVSCGLWKWDGDDLIVGFYPGEKENEVKTRREVARKNGLRGGRPEKTNTGANVGPNVGPHEITHGITQEKPTSVIFAKAEGEREGEGERKEKGNQSSAAPAGAPDGGEAAELFAVPPAAPEPTPPPPPAPAPATPAATPPRTRDRNPLFDALAEATDGAPSQLTADTARAVGVSLAKIVKVSPDLTPFEIARRAANYHTHFDGAALTAPALARHWARCDIAKAHGHGTSREYPGMSPDDPIMQRRNAF
jgi:hypothetical protein